MIQSKGLDASVEQRMGDEAWLAIDTATDNMTIAVMKGAEVIVANESTVERNHSVRLIPEIQELLQQAGISMRHIRAVAIGRGPGSYTGVRIGVTVAKTLAWSLGLPLVSVSSIEALACGHVRLLERGVSEATVSSRGYEIGDIVWIIPILDARRKQVFTGLYAWQHSKDHHNPHLRPTEDHSGDVAMNKIDIAGVRGLWQQLEHDRIVLFAEWMDHIRSKLRSCAEGSRPQRIVIVGETDHFQEDASALAEQTGVTVIMIDQDVHAQDIACLAWHKLVRQEVDDIHALVPNYTQLAEAEQKLLSKQR